LTGNWLKYWKNHLGKIYIVIICYDSVLDGFDKIEKEHGAATFTYFNFTLMAYYCRFKRINDNEF
jgi:hypothetical protein